MRLTVHLDTFDRVNPMAFAILWLDKDTLRWSREGHFGLDLPSWGVLNQDGANVLVCGHDGAAPVCVLDGFDLNNPCGPFEGETGCVHWCAERGRELLSGHWRVQCVDTETSEPEHGVFAVGAAA
ncbi:DUF3564 domain-containing protein [Paraburkholderia sp. MMS20-SJTR3]|uniref:DUF3564 domain-containing protein n=1 Tax=Paraburkholderia sejongensis TaxID=2886946 RepID=A0ABS8K1A2_9BURK|nr:DUF3564 domain-containing protein [Paraburkholderia sp. MMS20-SJTR3]MCC8395912.1 DUF3564 domain-containing protein [Paraburkholderia sp. MMS20-SJTR3]